MIDKYHTKAIDRYRPPSENIFIRILKSIWNWLTGNSSPPDSTELFNRDYHIEVARTNLNTRLVVEKYRLIKQSLLELHNTLTKTDFPGPISQETANQLFLAAASDLIAEANLPLSVQISAEGELIIKATASPSYIEGDFTILNTPPSP